MKTAKYMYKGRRYFYAVFMCHLSIEKALKGLYVSKSDELPPKTHNLIYVINKKGTLFPKEQIKERCMLKLFKKAYVDTRYNEDYAITKKELEWLGKRVGRQQKLTDSICKKKIKSFADNT